MENYSNPYANFHPTPTMWAIYLAIVVLTLAGLWKVFEKAGHPGWAALIPFYNIYIYFLIIGKPLWWVLIVFIPCVGVFIAIIWFNNLLSKSFGKGVGFTIGLIFLGFIFIPILGFGGAKYLGPGGPPPFNFSAGDYQNPFSTKP